MSNDEEKDHETQRAQLAKAAADLLPLAIDILGLSARMREPGGVPLSDDARSFFMYSVCLGIAQFFEAEVAHSKAQLQPAQELAPLIAAQLRKFSMKVTPAPMGN